MDKITDNRFNDDGFVYDDNNNQVSHLDDTVPQKEALKMLKANGCYVGKV